VKPAFKPARFPVMVLLSLVVSLAAVGTVEAESFLDSKCLKCHAEFKQMTNVLAGDFESLSQRAKSFQVLVGDTMEVIRFTNETETAHVESMKDLWKPIPVLVEFERRGEDLFATRVTAKPIIQVAEKDLIGLEELETLVALGPEKGNYTLLDSRPPIAYKEGHIPTAVSMPFGDMPNLLGRLPEDKDALLILYCGGFR